MSVSRHKRSGWCGCAAAVRWFGRGGSQQPAQTGSVAGPAAVTQASRRPARTGCVLGCPNCVQLQRPVPLTIPWRVPWCWAAARWPEQLHLYELGRGQLSFLALPGSQPGSDCVCMGGCCGCPPVYMTMTMPMNSARHRVPSEYAMAEVFGDTAVLLPDESRPALYAVLRVRGMRKLVV